MTLDRQTLRQMCATIVDICAIPDEENEKYQNIHPVCYGCKNKGEWVSVKGQETKINYGKPIQTAKKRKQQDAMQESLDWNYFQLQFIHGDSDYLRL